MLLHDSSRNLHDVIHSYNREAETNLDDKTLKISEQETDAGSYRVIASTAEASVGVRRA